MKHSIRERITDPIRGKVVKISTINAELGTGITDKNGKEIFESDIVKFEDGETFTVTFKNGAFYIGDPNDEDLLVDFYILPEVVGHVDD